MASASTESVHTPRTQDDTPLSHDWACTIEHANHNSVELDANPLDFSLSDENTLLARFRYGSYPKFPFVVVPLTTSAAQLREERPFLYDAILA